MVELVELVGFADGWWGWDLALSPARAGALPKGEPFTRCGRIWNRPYDNVSCGLSRFVVRCGTPRMSSPTMWWSFYL